MGIEPEKVKILLEEERDLNLIIEQIVNNPVSKTEIKSLSSLLGIKLTIFRFTKDTNFSVESKSSVSHAINKYLPILRKRASIHKAGENISDEQMALFCLISSGLNLSKNKTNSYVKNKAGELFLKCNKEMADSCDEWVEILNKIAKSKIIFI